MMNDKAQEPIAWIDTIPPETASGELKALYDAHTDRQHGCVDHILQIHSLNPEILQGHLSIYKTLMFGSSPLSRGAKGDDRRGRLRHQRLCLLNPPSRS